LVEGPFSAKFNQHGSSAFSECMSPIVSRSQIFVEWADLVVNLQFGRHVSSHKYSVKGISTTPSFKSLT
jgi:hypothetical protein